MLMRKRCSWNSRSLHLTPLVDVIVHGYRESSSFSNLVRWLSVLLGITFPHRFTVHTSVLVSFLSYVFGLVASALLVACFSSPAADADPFLLDEA